MFIGEAMCLVVYYIGVYIESRRTNTSGYHAIADTDADESRPINAASSNQSTTSPSQSSYSATAAPVVNIQEEVAPSLQGTIPADEGPKELVPLEGWKVLLLWLPTICDLTATSLMNVGLLFISASIYQMVRIESATPVLLNHAKSI
jgi:hypothetical protein